MATKEETPVLDLLGLVFIALFKPLVTALWLMLAAYLLRNVYPPAWTLTFWEFVGVGLVFTWVRSFGIRVTQVDKFGAAKE